jgi:predicted transposase/invertase (TIGR01784 family)
MFPEKEAIKSDHVILDRDTFEHDLTDFSFTFLELGKFNKSKDDIDALNSITEKWCYFFKYAEEVTADELAKLIEDDKVIEKAYQELDRFYWTTGELMGYEEAVKIRRDNKAVLDQKFDEGLSAGEAKGRREVALAMLSENFSDEIIVKLAKITAAELTALKRSLQK